MSSPAPKQRDSDWYIRGTAALLLVAFVVFSLGLPVLRQLLPSFGGVNAETVLGVLGLLCMILALFILELLARLRRQEMRLRRLEARLGRGEGQA